jgi:hypothetical protein
MSVDFDIQINETDDNIVFVHLNKYLSERICMCVHLHVGMLFWQEVISLCFTSKCSDTPFMHGV